MRAQNHTEQADCLQSKGFGPCRLRDLPAIYRVLYQAQGWRETLSSGDKHCPLWGVGESWINKLKTTPTPDKNVSYAIKVGVRMP